MERDELERWLFGVGPTLRQTQDSPILPDVWFAYVLPEELDRRDRASTPLVADAARSRAAAPEDPWGRRVDLLLRPHNESGAAELGAAIASRIEAPRTETLLAWNDVYVAARLTFEELVREVLPLSRWWQEYLWTAPAAESARRGSKKRSKSRRGPSFASVVRGRATEIEAVFRGDRPAHETRRAVHGDELSADLVWLVGIVGRIAWEWNAQGTDDAGKRPTASDVVAAALGVLGKSTLGPDPRGRPLWSVTRNRPVASTVWRSRVATKADAATRLFKLSCRDIRWAILDSGIDARHPAFARRDGDEPVAADGNAAADSARSRIVQTYDFSDIRGKLAAAFAGAEPGETAEPASGKLSIEDPVADDVREVQAWVTSGRAVDWGALQESLRIQHDGNYAAPRDEHGTHVAGILGGDWRPTDLTSPGRNHVEGVCPDIDLYDLRVFGADGTGDEFSILSAMQFVRYLNAHADRPVIHGVNLSFTVEHEVAKYAAGRTPVCEEADRLVDSGVIVVAAAGNDGRAGYAVKGRSVEGYRTVSIADPGNAESVITVGATHRSEPHTYGVSYFSSRGPTGDGRAKPDLVAPGEKIVAPVPDGGLKSLDGTSQAAPHVSGAAALLIARHPELIRQPRRVKEILCATCTDLGRERSFQGAGMVDVLRAIQAV